ncbi:MAG: DNA-formamidopyrimidine glycosylase family protein, partial [Actinomycetota bacterium]
MRRTPASPSAWPPSQIPEENEVELPEVEVMRRDLERDVVGRRIKDAEVKSSRNAMRAIRRHKTR